MSSKAPLPPVDETVQLPKAIRDLAAKADALHAQSYSKEQPAAPAEPQVTPPATPPVEPPADPPATPPVEPPALAPATPPADDKNFERAYKGMKGRYERSQQQVQQLSDNIRDLRATVETLQRAQKDTPRTPDPEPESVVTEQDLSEYGPDMLALIRKMAKAEAKALNKQLQDKVDTLEGQVGHVQDNTVQATRKEMLRELSRVVPNWEELDKDETFLEWLALPDPYAGVIRHELLGHAYRHNDAARVANFFQGFLAEEAAKTPAGSTREEPPAPATPPAPALSLEALAAPGRAKSTAPNLGPVEKPIITRADIAKFYTEKNRGAYTPAQIAEYEGELWAAQREGRIR